MYYNEGTVVYHDGEWLHPKDLGCSLYSQTLHYGQGVFEGIRSYQTSEGPRVYRAREHYERLKASCEKVHINLQLSVDELISVTDELLEKNSLGDAYIRPLIYQGDGMALIPNQECHVFIGAWEWGRYLGDNLLKVMISSYQRPNPKSIHIEAKTCGHYINSMLATTEAKAKGFDEALLLDMNGHIAEGPGANFFYEKDKVIYTAPLGQILPGITRNAVMELAQANGIEVREEYFNVDTLKKADSAFFTGTAAEVVGLERLDDYVFPLHWEESLGHRLSELYSEDVRTPQKVIAS